MKHTIIVLISFLLLLTSCSSNQVTLTMRDGAKIESELLSVRDSSIVIQEKGGAPIVIMNDDMSNITWESVSPVLHVSVMSLGFAAGGAMIGLLFPRQLECKEPTICRYTYPAIGYGALVGLGLGTVLGLIDLPQDKVFYMNDTLHRNNLSRFAKYSEKEPDELKKIK